MVTLGTNADRPAVIAELKAAAKQADTERASVQGNLDPALLVPQEGVSIEQQKVRSYASTTGVCTQPHAFYRQCAYVASLSFGEPLSLRVSVYAAHVSHCLQLSARVLLLATAEDMLMYT